MSEIMSDFIDVNGIRYVRVDSNLMAEKLEGLEYCVVRTFSAGVHLGFVKDFGLKHEKWATLLKAKRLWSWTDACSLSQVALDGVGDASKISVEVPVIYLTEVIEVIPMSDKAKKIIEGIATWKK